MTQRPYNPTRRRERGAWLRHGASAAAALAFNAVLVCLLATGSARVRPEAGAPVRAVPLTVVESEPMAAEPAPPAPAEPEAAVEVVEPAAPPMLPPLDPPSPAAPLLAAAAPPLPALAVAHRMDVPDFLAEAGPPVASPAIAAPVAVSVAPAVTAPAAGPPSNTQGPSLLSQPSLADYYPRRALLRGITGRTRLRLALDSQGRVTDVQVLASTPAGVFDHAAGRVGRVLRFRPALREGRPVPGVACLDIVWKVD